MSRSRFAIMAAAAAELGKFERCPRLVVVLGVPLFVACAGLATASAQTGSTGAVAGTVRDESTAVLPGVDITVTNAATGVVRTVISDDRGAYSVPLLAPGQYQLEAQLSGFKKVATTVQVTVTETATLDLRLEVGTLNETVTVAGLSEVVQTQTAALGRVVDSRVVQNLPLVTRNFTQILGLSPGIAADVTNAAELGRGGGGRVVAGVRVHGTQAYDNSFQMDGIAVNDYEASTAGNSAGVPIPSPDSIQEFKVQTGQFDAAFGRHAGANVNLVTKSGSNSLRALGFEYFRDAALNANNFFFQSAGQDKPVLSQHQYGGTIGGPLVRDTLFFFTSYQGTRQRNGSPGGVTKSTCANTVFTPPLTDDRSREALGRMFGGQSGVFGGTAVAADGSNINPVALMLLNLKLPNGQYLYASPQVIDTSRPLALQGFSAVSDPCTFNENQGMLNLEFRQSDNTTWSSKTFTAKGVQMVPFAASGANVLGSPLGTDSDFVVSTLAHNHVFSSRLYNELRGGVTYNLLQGHANPAFTWSSVGVNVGGDTTAFRGPHEVDAFPSVSIAGSYNIANTDSIRLPQWNYNLVDSLSYIAGRHSIRTGIDLLYQKTDVLDRIISGSLTFRSFPDFLLGMSGIENGSGSSNVFSSSYNVGPGQTIGFRTWSSAAYLQDDIQFDRLTLNAGLRFEFIGQVRNSTGMAMNFDPARANPDPPAGGTLEGYVVPSDALEQTPPAGVTKVDNPFTLEGGRQAHWAPRAGFALKVLPNSSRVVLRGGFGLYYTRTPGITLFSALNTGAYKVARTNPNATTNIAATFQNPFQQPVPTTFPAWSELVYSPTTRRNTSSIAMDFVAPMTKQGSLNLQLEIAPDTALEIGYVGGRSDNQVQTVHVNQARLASPSDPIRGLTTNTVANVANRVPILGWQPLGIPNGMNTGRMRYDGLETSLSKRFSRGFQFLASYTMARALITSTVGDQTNLAMGPGDFNRRHRFIFSYMWEVPAPKTGVLAHVFGNWSIAGVSTLQSGSPLTITAVSPNNAYGITTDRVQLVAGCDLKNPGSTTANLDDYLNKACIAPFPIIGSDGRAVGFGNSGVGIVTGPGQRNTDLTLVKRISLNAFKRNSLLELRAEAFNVFNATQFSNPDVNSSNATFGTISSTSVSSRVGQLAVRYSF